MVVVEMVVVAVVARRRKGRTHNGAAGERPNGSREDKTDV